MVVNCAQVNAFLFDGYWEDIGTIKSFFEENLKLAQMCVAGQAVVVC